MMLPDRRVLETMTLTLRHRGPDGFGYFTSGGVSLGHARLAVLDLEHGEQPMQNESGSITVVFNGEIYNHVLLREDLERRGHRFRSRSDTEVLVHGYEEWGHHLLDRIDGMFAFAVWDAERSSILLARDRFGEKPLYIAEQNGAVFFASEPRALLVHPGLSRELDPNGLILYMTLDYIPAPLSPYRVIRKLPPATYLLISPDGRQQNCYWTLPQQDCNDVDLDARFEQLLCQSVKERLRADVPVGIALSGGLDSASILCAAARSIPPEQLTAYTISFSDADYDESPLAAATARHFSVRHVVRRMEPSTMREVIPELISKLDEPLADASLIPTYLLSRTMREEVTVALGGDGGDELMAGYPIFQAHRIAPLLSPLPPGLRGWLARALPAPPSRAHPFAPAFVLKRFVAGTEYTLPKRQLYWQGGITPAGASRLFVDPPANPGGILDAIVTRAMEGSENLDAMSQASMLCQRTYLAEDILQKVDRASMAASLEFRAPYLGRQLAEFLWRVPTREKISGPRSKILLRRFLARNLPAPIARAPKRGFGIPIARWFSGEMRADLTERLQSSALTAIFKRAQLRRLLEDHLSGRDQRQLLWRLYVLGAFLEQH